MMPFALTLAAAGLVLTVADKVPTHDMKPTCRAAIEMMGNQGRTVESCVASEIAARDEIVKMWSQVPNDEKTLCAKTALQGGSPSYVEFLICLEMNRDSRTRAQQLKAEQAKAKLQKPAARQ
jgi:hypothetical protein